MKLARYAFGNDVTYGVVDGEWVTPVSGIPFGTRQLQRRRHALADVKLLMPCTPTKVLAIGLNYPSHLGGQAAPTQPEPFLKAPNSFIGPGDAIVLPKGAGRVDEEAELVVVIGKRCSKVAKSQALDYVLGYTCGNDVSARVWQKGDRHAWRAKSSDTFAPFGPYIVTDLDGGNLDIYARVNGREVQHCRTSELLFDIPTVVSFISQAVTLEPGDLIFTGTSGAPAELHGGDVVEIEIPGIGTLRNPVQAEGQEEGTRNRG